MSHPSISNETTALAASNELAQLRAELKALRETVTALQKSVDAVLTYLHSRLADDTDNGTPALENPLPALNQDASEPQKTPTEFPHIIKVKGKHGGSPLLKESYISVKTIAAFTKMGFSPAKLVAEYVGELNLAEVHEALAYYYRHIDEIESYLQADERAESEFRQRMQAQS